MSVRWIPFPLPGTSVLPGRWLCTIQSRDGKTVLPMDLDKGAWRHVHGRATRRDEVVTAIAHMPEPYLSTSNIRIQPERSTQCRKRTK